MHYTLSIAMTKTGKFLFVDKTHGPMAGTLIFPGGKVEDGETPIEANAREFAEETDIVTLPEKWVEIATINYPTYTLHCFLLAGQTLRDSLLPSQTDTGEAIQLIDMREYFEENELGYKYSSKDGRMDGLCAALIGEIVYKL